MGVQGTPWEIGKSVVRRQGKDVALLGYGTIVNDCLEAAELLAANGVEATVVDLRYALVLLPVLEPACI